MHIIFIRFLWQSISACVWWVIDICSQIHQFASQEPLNKSGTHEDDPPEFVMWRLQRQSNFCFGADGHGPPGFQLTCSSYVFGAAVVWKLISKGLRRHVSGEKRHFLAEHRIKIKSHNYPQSRRLPCSLTSASWVCANRPSHFPFLRARFDRFSETFSPGNVRQRLSSVGSFDPPLQPPAFVCQSGWRCKVAVLTTFSTT